jgi:tRNA (mo5U34)-methyltransferase
VKTLTRLSMHGAHAKVFIQDCAEVDKSFGTFDVVFHFGVLYHMMNPVEHLLNLGQVAPVLYLDTHIAGPKLVTGEYSVNGEAFDFDWRGEGGWREPFSGVAPKSRQLTLDGLNKALEMAGYTDRQLLQERAERNGPRILMLARKPGA